MSKISFLTVSILAFLFISPAEAANTQSTFSAGTNFFQQATSGVIAQTGYFLHFQVEERDRWVRPTYGGMIEFSSSTNRLIDGAMFGGFDVVADSAVYVKPFVGGAAFFGSANLFTPTNSYVGMIFGGLLSAGAEIRLSEKSKSLGLRIASIFRYSFGSVGGGLSATDLNSLGISLGFCF